MATEGSPNRLQRARLAAGLSLGQVASVLGVARELLTDWETGADSPNPYHYERIAATFGVRASWLSDSSRTIDSDAITLVGARLRQAGAVDNDDLSRVREIISSIQCR